MGSAREVVITFSVNSLLSSVNCTVLQVSSNGSNQFCSACKCFRTAHTQCPVLVRNLVIDCGNTGSLGNEKIAVILLIACGTFAGIDKQLKRPRQTKPTNTKLLLEN